MGNNKIKEFLNFVKVNASYKYPKLVNLVDFLRSERIKFTGNDLRSFLDIEKKDVDRDGLCSAVKEINEIASVVGFDFYLSPKYEEIEKFLRLTILDDLGEEFERQGV